MSKSLKNIGVVAGATMGSRVLGLVRDMLTTTVFGTTALASAFYTAFTLPNLFRRLLGEGALTAALVPTLNDQLATNERPGAFALVSQVASWLLVVTGTLVALAMVAMSQIGRLHGGVWGADAETVRRWVEAADLAVVLFPYLVLVCLAAVFSAALQTLNRFLEPALTPVWLNLAIIGGLVGGSYLGWASDDAGRMRWLCAGVLTGGTLQLLVPAWTLMREGWRPRFDLGRSEPLRQIVRLMIPSLFGSAIYLINMAVARFVGLSLNDSAAAVLNLATRVMELPIGVFAVAVSTVMFPLISRYAALGDQENLAVAYRKGMRLILMVNIPAAVGLIVLSKEVVRLLFQRGAFNAEDTAKMAPVLAVFALGLPLFSFVNLVLRAFYARKDTATPVRAAALSFVVNLGLSLWLMRSLSTVGLALASNVAVGVQAWYLQRKLARGQPGLAFGHLAGDCLKIAAASVAMGAVVWGGDHLWHAWVRTTLTTEIAGVALWVGMGIGCYAALLWALKIEGREELIALLRRRRSAA